MEKELLKVIMFVHLFGSKKTTRQIIELMEKQGIERFHISIALKDMLIEEITSLKNNKQYYIISKCGEQCLELCLTGIWLSAK